MAVMADVEEISTSEPTRTIGRYSTYATSVTSSLRMGAMGVVNVPLELTGRIRSSRYQSAQ